MKSSNLKTREFKINHISQDKEKGITRLSVNEHLWFEIYLDNDEQFFKHNDYVQVVFDEKNKNVLAVLNKTQKIFYLKQFLNSFKSKTMLYSFSRCLLIFFISYTFCFGMVLAHQWIGYGDLFWGDVYDLIPYLLGFSAVIGVSWFLMSEEKEFKDVLGGVYVAIKWPFICNETLSSFQATNSYFELYDDIYDVEQILTVIKQHSSIEAKDIIENGCKQKDKFDLTEIQREKFKLVHHNGHMNALSLNKINKSQQHTDPLIHLRAKLDNIPIYGYVDEFYNQNKVNMNVIRSSFRDLRGYYFWFMSDDKEHVYLDEDMLIETVYAGEKWKVTLVTCAILLATDAFFSFFCAAGVEDGIFWDQFCYIFLIILAFYFWVTILGWLYFKFFKIENKFQKQKNINAYVAEQLIEMIKLTQIKKLSDLKPYRMKRQNQEDMSRTGFDLKFKAGRFESK